jgi:hypothetical protein
LEKKVEELQKELLQGKIKKRIRSRSRHRSPRSRSPRSRSPIRHEKQKNNERKIMCYYCGGIGHITRYCKQKFSAKNCIFCGGTIHKTLRDCPNDPHNRNIGNSREIWEISSKNFGEEIVKN